MELPDFPIETHDSLHDLLSHSVHRESAIGKKAAWSSEEDKMFENALVDLDPTSPSFFEDIASKVQRKAIDEIKDHYQALIEDVEMIECGEIPIPNYKSDYDITRDHNINCYQKEKCIEMEKNQKNAGGGASSAAACSNAEAKTRQSCRKGVPWTEEEHRLFLMGLNRYGRGDWRSISRYYVITKTPTQVASHAQKDFKRQTSTTPIDRRRPSIHDIKTVNHPNAFAMPRTKHAGDQGRVNDVGPRTVREIPSILHDRFSANSSIHARITSTPSPALHNYITSNGDIGSTVNNSRMFPASNYSGAGAVMFPPAEPVANQASGHVATHLRR